MTEFWIQENDKYMLNDLCNIIDGRGFLRQSIIYAGAEPVTARHH